MDFFLAEQQRSMLVSRKLISQSYNSSDIIIISYCISRATEE
jgi:hypothetical protein